MSKSGELIKGKRPYDDIVDRVLIALDVSSDAAAGRALGFERQTVTGWRTKGIPQKTVFDKLEHVFADWIMTGHGPMRKGDEAEERLQALYAAIGKQFIDLVREALTVTGEAATTGSASVKRPAIPKNIADILEGGTTIISNDNTIPGPSPDFSPEGLDFIRKRRKTR